MNKKEKTLILTQTDPENDVVFHIWIENGYHADIIFKPQPKIMRAFRRIWLKYRLPAGKLWYGGWKRQIDRYDTLIIHASSLTKGMDRWIHRNNPEVRIIYWYWNIVDKETIPKKISGRNVEYWSFDGKDCEKYQMRKNIQYYGVPLSLSELKTVQDIESDIYFMGHDQGRRQKILEVEKHAREQGLICDFHIVSHNDLNIPYREIQKQLQKSRAVLEINRSRQIGFTLRTMESLFFDKKLITDNAAVLDAPFYRKSNIFIIGYDNIADLKKFMEVPYDKSVTTYREQYSLDTWFNNFFVKKEEML